MNIVIFGYPTAGKGTQAELLAKEYAIPHISTGDIFRDNMKRKTPLGIEIDELMRAGNLVPDLKTIEIVLTKLNELGEGWILDGFPRSFEQAVAFKGYIDEKGWDVKYIYLEVSREQAYERSIKRSEIEGRFEDASPEVINKRLDIYEETTSKAVYHFIRETEIIDGTQSIDDVFLDIEKHILMKGF
jgi:adenylate kinase